VPVSSKTLALPAVRLEPVLSLSKDRSFASFRANDFLRTGSYFEAAVIHFASGPQICLPLRPSPPQFYVCRFSDQPVFSLFPGECLT